MAANADAHFDPKVLSFLQDTSSIVPHRDSGSARALEKSGELGKHNVSMYIQLRMTMWTLLTLRGNMWGLLNRDQHAAGQPARYLRLFLGSLDALNCGIFCSPVPRVRCSVR